VDATTTARAVQRFYDLGVKPDWWKLEPDASPDCWSHIERAIISNDPHCRGVVLLGLSAPKEQLMQSFPAAARSSVVRGFAVGRTIFSEPAKLWFAGKITDDAAITAMASGLSELVDAWRGAKMAHAR
jgi:5-dehydro-2-deoxygluconokinase